MADRCSHCGLSPYESGIGDSDISRILSERNQFEVALSTALSKIEGGVISEHDRQWTVLVRELFGIEPPRGAAR